MELSTPVVLIIYRRPDLIRRVAERIAAANPPLLLVVADGPLDESERRLCEASRDVIRQFTWSEVRWNAADANLGLRARVSSGIDWAFSQVERAIILEDDCLPEPTFFPFCEALLERYRDDERVMEVAGSSLTADSVDTNGASYYFSRYYHPWGWATWRRAWSLYDVNIARWPSIRRQGGFSFDTWFEKRFWSTVFDRLHAGEFNTWDYQWLFAMLCHSGMSAVPKTNLVTNIGFGPGGTHYTGNHSFGNMKPGALPTLSHPEVMIRNAGADRAEFKAAGNRFMRLARVELGRFRTRRIHS